MTTVYEKHSQQPAPHRPRMSLGLTLLARGDISPQQLEIALTRQETSAGELGTILCQLGYVNEHQVAAAAAAQWGYPTFAVDTSAPPVRPTIPVTLLEYYSIAPLRYFSSANKLLVGFVHRIEHGMVSALEQMTDTVIAPCVITQTAFHATLAAMHRVEDIRFEQVSSPTEAGSITANYALQLKAEVTRVARCPHYAWVRLLNRGREVDLLFHLPRTGSQRVRPRRVLARR